MNDSPLFPSVRDAVEPLKAAAMERARVEAIDYCNRLLQHIEYAGGNLDILAPYPDSMQCDRQRYVDMKRRRDTYEMLCTSEIKNLWNQPARRLRPYESRSFARYWHYITPNADKIARFVDESVKAAGIAYDAFVAKLEGKIGEVESAWLKGSHVWGYSILTVSKKDGSVEYWKTQQIVNQSSLGLLFNQWPSRKVKTPA